MCANIWVTENEIKTKIHDIINLKITKAEFCLLSLCLSFSLPRANQSQSKQNLEKNVEYMAEALISFPIKEDWIRRNIQSQFLQSQCLKSWNFIKFNWVRMFSAPSMFQEWCQALKIKKMSSLLTSRWRSGGV